MLSCQHACVCVCATIVAKHEIGLLVTNRWPLISASDFLLSLSAYQSLSVPLSPALPQPFPTLHHILLSIFSLSISFSLHTFSIFLRNILNPTLHFLSLSPFFLPGAHYLFFSSTHPQPDPHFSNFFQSFKKSLCVRPYSNTRCHSTAVQLCSDLLHN